MKQTIFRDRFCGIRLFLLPFRKDTGFTLLEVMIAVSILAITLVTLFGSQSKSLSMATEAKFNTVAPMLALAKLAEIESGTTPFESDSGNFGDGFAGFSWEIETANVSFETPEALSELDRPLDRMELSINWEGAPYTYRLVYYDQRRN